MTYKLAKKLKDAGFPQDGGGTNSWKEGIAKVEHKCYNIHMNPKKLEAIMSDITQGIPHRVISKKRNSSPSTITKIRRMMMEAGHNLENPKRGRPKIVLPNKK